jgi:hypothetical protein
MAKSVPLSETISLGKKIVEEFSNDGHCDDTVRWMAHYLAELISNSENETNEKKKAELQKQCVNVILSLWAKRSTFPNNTAPLSNLTHVLAILSSLKTGKDMSWRQFMLHEDGSPWGKFMYGLRTDFEHALRTSLFMNIAAPLLKKEKEWLAHSKHLSKQEKDVLQQFDQFIGRGRTTIVFITSDPNSKATPKSPPLIEQGFDTIKEMLESQLLALEKLRSDVSHNEKPKTRVVKRRKK